MRISLNWLRELVDLELSPEELAHLLTMAGFEVEDIEDRRTWADGVVLGKIVECEPHPNGQSYAGNDHDAPRRLEQPRVPLHFT